jgi:hypothetical protein
LEKPRAVIGVTARGFLLQAARRYTSEDRVDERREGGRLRENEEHAHQDEDDDDREQPVFFVLAEEEPDFVGESELAHQLNSLPDRF